MIYKKRLCSKKLSRLVAHFPVIVVSGARQVGKSTLLKHCFPDLNLVVFDPVTDVGNARADPDLFLDNHPPPLILDEIQYCPEVVSAIKRLIDRDRKPGQYILTGSQQWGVMKSIGESLAGRVVFLNMEGFSMSEVCEAVAEPSWLQSYLDAPFDFVKAKHSRLPSTHRLFEQLWRGWLPEMDSLPTDLAPDFFAAFLRTYIERDIRLLLDADDWQQFGRFVQMVAVLTAQEINYSQLGRDIGITPQSARRWLAALKATFQWHEAPAWHGNTVKRVSSKPKGYFSDTGLASHLAGISSPRSLGGHPIIGSLFETAVMAEIRKLMVPLSQKARIYHWRSHGGAEVDCVLERDGMLYPIEVKLGTRPSRKDARGLQALRETYPNQPIAPGLVLAPVSDFEQLTEHDYSSPWDMAQGRIDSQCQSPDSVQNGLI